MDSLELLTIKRQLERMFEKYSEEEAKKLIIKCIDDKFIKKDTDISKIQITNTAKLAIEDVCRMCESKDFNNTASQMICRECGTIHRELFNRVNYKPKEELKFISKSENTISYIDTDGKKKNIDIDKINLYTLKNLTPHQRIFKSGSENIKNKLIEYNIPYKADQLNDILRMYWNITLYYDKNERVKPNIKSVANKQAYQALCAYYGLDESVNIYEILEAFDVTIENLEYFNQILKVIFNKTSYEIKNRIKPEDNLTYSIKKVADIADKLINILIEKSLFKEKNKENYAAVILYVSRDILSMKTTSIQIQNELNISNSAKLNLNYRKILNYLKENKRLITLL
jgi:hypothetical protein